MRNMKATSNIQILWKIQVKDDKTGKIVSTKKGKSKSLVLQFLQHIQVILFQANVTMKDTGGTNRSEPTVAPYGQPIAGDATYGIVVGTGTTAVGNTDNKLTTQIAHGSGAAQLNYGAESQVAAQVVGANVDYTHSRTFQNLSGATITITEIGMYVKDSTNTWYFCWIHDLATQAVLNNQTATVTYTFRTTV